METRKLTCIGCPMGCELSVEFEKGKRETVKVTGNTCKKGELYAIDEVISPTRTVTGTISVSNRKNVVAPVKTADVVPKAMVMEVARGLMELSIEAPVKIGDVVCDDIVGTKVSVIATKNID